MSRRAGPPIRTIALAGLASCVLAAPPPAGAARSSPLRVWKEKLAAPAQFDLSLTEVRFSKGTRAARTRSSASRLARSIRLVLAGPGGLYYVAGAVTRPAARRPPRVLVLVVNRRPRGSLAPDLAYIRVALTAARRLGAPVLSRVIDPFTRLGRGGPAPRLCELPIAGPLPAAALRGLLGRGPALAGFDSRAAIARAYDAVCGKAYDPAFRAAVTGSTPGCATVAALSPSCCPPDAICAPPPCPPEAICAPPPCPPCGTTPCSPCACPPCACPPCPLAAGRQARSAIACPLDAQPIACSL